MTMNNETKLTTEQRIQRSIEHNEAKLQKAEEKRKQLKEQRRALEKQAYENRLTTRALLRRRCRKTHASKIYLV